MKIEQACRFRMDEGYCIFAKSPGLTPSQEGALGDAFNGAMNTIFPSTGSSILSCIPGRTNAFYAKNTLRTDILGRKTIFTHTYVLSTEEYAKIMEESPMTLLGIPMSQMLDSQASGTQMEQLSLSPQTLTNEQLDALFQKYNLTPARYSQLLMGAYEAMTSNGSLQLKTKLSMEQTELLVREITCCVLDGLLPVLKGRISFSSGADTRMNISVLSAQDTSSQAADIVFGVDDDSDTNIRPKDEMCAMAFDALSRASHEQRRQTLLTMEAWLGEVTNIQEGLSLMVISLAYCLCQEQAADPETLLMLFRNVRTAGKGFSNSVTNSLLTELVRKINAQNYHSSNALSQIAGWYLRESSEQYRAEADRSFAQAPTDICVALVDAAFKQSMTDSVRQMLRALLPRIAPEDSTLPMQTQEKTVAWILDENVEEFISYGTVLANKFSEEQMFNLAKGILANVAQREPTAAQETMLCHALMRITTFHMALTQEECAVLDGLTEQCREPLTRTALDYLFIVRLPEMGIETGVALFTQFQERYPNLLRMVAEQIHSGQRKVGECWEHYMAQHCFTERVGWKEIGDLCQKYNSFKNPDGAFEKKAAEAVAGRIDKNLANPLVAGEDLSYLCSKFIPSWLGYIKGLNISQDTREWLKDQLLDKVWSTVDYDQLYNARVDVNVDYMVVTPASQLKIFLYKIRRKLKTDPRNVQNLIDTLEQPLTSEETKEELVCNLPHLAYVILKDQRFLSWDIVLLSCRKKTEKGIVTDTRLLVEICEKLDKIQENQGFTAESRLEDSKLLEDEKMRKTVMHMGGDLPACLKDLCEQMKPAKKKFLSGLLGREDDGEKKSEDEAEDGEKSSKHSRGKFSRESELDEDKKRSDRREDASSGRSLFGKRRG